MYKLGNKKYPRGAIREYSWQVTYLDQLNERQREAVLATEGPISVLAGAGSGKTKVLTTRIYHLIRNGVAPENILAVTFTNKAAREMRERLSNMLGEDVPMPFISTFHGLGREILERYGSIYGIPRYFTIYDRDDSIRTIKDALKILDIDPKEVEPRVVLSMISKAKGKGMGVDRFSAEGAQKSFIARTTATIWNLYQDALTKEKAFDFDDLISLPVQLLREHGDLRERLQKRFHYVHVDEFQDTNELQAEFIEIISGARKNVFVVGDIDQCIYTWRQATIENLLSFDATYPGAKNIVLEHNYRSTKTIVEASNGVIERNRNRKEKTAITDNPEGNKIELHVLDTGEAEARFIARDAMSRIANGVNAGEIAVLYRTNFQSRVLEEAFLRTRVPYRVLGTRFMDRREVKDVISWMRLALEPTREADMVRAVQTPSRGIGKVTIAKIAAGQSDQLKGAVADKVKAFLNTVTVLNEESKTMMPSEFVRRVIELSGMEKVLREGSEDDAERLLNAQELATLATRYDNATGTEAITAFLADVALSGDQDELDRPKNKGDGVTLMTIHAAKGLEFEVVYITGLEQGLFPHDFKHQDEERDEEEERRLFYVAMTRAKKELVLTMARVRRMYGTDYLAEPSSFIGEIDPSLVQVEWQDGEDVVYI